MKRTENKEGGADQICNLLERERMKKAEVEVGRSSVKE